MVSLGQNILLDEVNESKWVKMSFRDDALLLFKICALSFPEKVEFILPEHLEGIFPLQWWVPLIIEWVELIIPWSLQPREKKTKVDIEDIFCRIVWPPFRVTKGTGLWSLVLDKHGLLNPITSLDFENCISSGNPAHTHRREVLDEKSDLGLFRNSVKMGKKYN